MTLLLKIPLFYGWVGFLLTASAKSYSSHSIALSLSTDLATQALLPSKGRMLTVPALLASIFSCGPDRRSDPLKDIFVYFKVLQRQLAQSSVLKYIKNKVN